ncbi:MAG: hypothetical protein Q9157_006059 [Trypethelium eluteriae]
MQCKRLSEVLEHKVVFPGSQEYTNSTTSYWRAQENIFTPDCIVIPENREDVAIAVRTIVDSNKSSLCKFAIRGGGHTSWNGSSNLDNGVVIDMRRLTSVKWDADEKVASVGAGSTWENVYHSLQEHGVTVVGGRAAAVGVGGLILGGGISYFSGRKGFACDNVLNYEVVLGDGRIVNANAQENSDLWRVLKGGSNNFGIVTRFDMETFEQGHFWGGRILWLITANATASALLDAFVHLNCAELYDPNAALILSFSSVPETGIIASGNIEYGLPENNPKAFERFTEIQPQVSNTMRISNQLDFAKEFEEGMPNGQRTYFITSTFGNDREFLTTVYNYLIDASARIANVTGAILTLSIQPISTKLLEESTKRGGNMLGLHPSEGPLVLCLISATWTRDTDDDVMNRVGQELDRRIVAAARGKGLLNNWIYLNYASSWQGPLHGYGSQSEREMQAASLKYDPNGIFQTLVPGGFKLF